MARNSSASPLDAVLAEQQAYYRSLAPEYIKHALHAPGGDEVVAALDAFKPTGDVLELACGPGSWTGQLLAHADSVTAVDGAAEMLEIAATRIGGDPRVQFVHADLFAWRPERRYDAVFFGFWISHVPLERFASFWSLVRECLTPAGRVMFVDDAHRTPDELAYGADSEPTAPHRRRPIHDRQGPVLAARPGAPDRRPRLGRDRHRHFWPVLLGRREQRLIAAEGGAGGLSLLRKGPVRTQTQEPQLPATAPRPG